MSIVRLCLLFTFAALCLASDGLASQILGDADVSQPTLKVGANGMAVVQYVTKAGAERHVLVWGAINASAHPADTGSVQETFRMDYSGGWKSRHNPRYWRTVADRCGRYDGPALTSLVAGCKAPDGSYWALQAWQRNLPMRGFAPWTERQRAVELHISHWRGPLPELEIYRHWTYGNAPQGIFGRLLYQGEPVYGTRTPSPSVRDSFSRNVYIGTLNSDYGPGWKHDTAIVAHPRNGGFCYTFVPQAPPSGYPSGSPNGNGLGERHAVTAMGPGVTPVIRWEGPRLTRFDPAFQAEATRAFDRLLGGDRHCAPER